MISSRKNSILISISLLFCMLSLLDGCSTNDMGKKGDSNPAAKWIIAVTIVPEQTFVQAVCGDLAEVITLVPPGNSPENYEPIPQIMEKFSKSSLYFSIGVPTEEANILPDAEHIKTISLAREVAAVYPERIFESGGRDPHIWLSPKRVKVMIEAIERTMVELDQINKEIYEKNAAAYIEKLDVLDQKITDVLKNVKNRKFIVYHPAFGYLADDYKLIMYALEEEGKEATAKHLQDMIDFAEKEEIKVLFYQEEIDGKQAQAFAEEIGAKTIKLAPLAADYIKNLESMAETMSEVMQ